MMRVNIYLPRIRFEPNWQKCIEGIDLLAQQMPGITQYYVGKLFYFADKEHLIDWGRPISGNWYAAMDHGPVPSEIYDMLKVDWGGPDDVVDAMECRVAINQDGSKRRVYSKNLSTFPSLTQSEIECLLASHEKYAKLSFSDLRRITHDEIAYKDAWDNRGPNSIMDVALWLEGNVDNVDNAISQIKEHINSGAL